MKYRNVPIRWLTWKGEMWVHGSNQNDPQFQWNIHDQSKIWRIIMAFWCSIHDRRPTVEWINRVDIGTLNNIPNKQSYSTLLLSENSDGIVKFKRISMSWWRWILVLLISSSNNLISSCSLKYTLSVLASDQLNDL